MKPDELEQVYRRYYDDVYLYAFSFCRSHYTAQELVSDTFFNALLSVDIRAEGIRIKYWLLRVCKNLAIDRYRREKRISDQSIEDFDQPVEDSTLEQILQDEQRRAVYKAVLELPEPYREVLTLFYYLETDTKEIAASLGISGGSVRTLLYRGRNKLREQLKNLL